MYDSNAFDITEGLDKVCQPRNAVEVIEWQTFPLSLKRPSVDDLDLSQFQQISKFKGIYAQVLCRKSPWIDTVIEKVVRHGTCTLGDGSKPTCYESASLRRMDEMAFSLVPSQFQETGLSVFYVLNNDTGLELISVDKIFCRHSMRVKGALQKLEVQYFRVKSTVEAAEDCDREEDYISGQHALLGSSSLQKCRLDQMDRNLISRTTYHVGDVPFWTSACNIVGLVGGTKYPIRAMQESLFDNLKSLCSIRRLDDVDWVHVGDRFSDHDPIRKHASVRKHSPNLRKGLEGMGDF